MAEEIDEVYIQYQLEVRKALKSYGCDDFTAEFWAGGATGAGVMAEYYNSGKTADELAKRLLHIKEDR